MLQPALAPRGTGCIEYDGLFGRKAQGDRQTCCPLPGAPLTRVMFASSRLAVGTILREPSRLPAPQHDSQVLERQAGNAPAGRS